MTYTLPTKNIFFPEQKEPLYDPADERVMRIFHAYWAREKERCVDGFYLADGQVFIPPHMYFHHVYWKIAMYVERGGRKARIIDTPLLRDVDWEVITDLEKCQNDGRFYGLVGSRDWGKSIIAASRAGWTYTFFKNSECVISGGAESYIKLATDKIEDGLTNLHPIWKKQRISTDWRKEVRAGWKDKKTNQPHPNSFNSRIIMRNYQDGNNTMAANGTRPGFHLIDEIGTLPNLIGCIKDSDGCWWSGDGDKPSCLSMFTGTGGDMEVGAEAAEIFFNPEAYNLLSFENPETSGKMGRFVSALRARMGYKEPKTLSEFLGISHPDLDRITILISNEERAYNEWWKPQYDKAIKSGNPKTVLKFKAYWPLKASDSFLILTQNDYNIEAAKKQQGRLRITATENNSLCIGEPVDLYNDGEKINFKPSDKLPITEFPVKTQGTDAPVIIWEHPMVNPPWGLYIAGIDPYRHDVGDSLGAIYIYKRMHGINTEYFQDMFVASYVARPAKISDWNETARLLIKYYNALAFCENDEMSFINYMINKGDTHYLSPVPQWLKDQIPFSTAALNRDYGVHSSVKSISFYRSNFKSYLDDPIIIERDEKGSVTREHLGVERIQDLMLLEEIVKLNKDGNFDRERAASIAVTAANKMIPLGKVNSLASDPRYQSLFGKKLHTNNKLFKTNRRTFSTLPKPFK